MIDKVSTRYPRTVRQIADYLHRSLKKVRFDRVHDRRSVKGRQWDHEDLLKCAMLGLLAGCKGLRELEELSEKLASTSGKHLGIRRRVPDTTLRDFLCLDMVNDLRGCLHRTIRAARKRKALTHDGLPFHVAALDGKGTAVPVFDQRYAQRTRCGQTQKVLGIVRSITCTLVSAPGRPCLDAVPLAAEHNEMSGFERAFNELLKHYGGLFRLITYDAGAASKRNGQMIVDANKDYLFRLRNEQRVMLKLARTLLDDKDAIAQTTDLRDQHTEIIRRLYAVPVLDHPKSKNNNVWRHTQTLLRIETLNREEGHTVTVVENRYFNSSLRFDALTPEQWLHVARSHWGVENNGHNILDVAFEEDKRPWITWNPTGTMNVMILRRIAQTLMTLYRSVTLRSEENRATPWKTLMRRVYDALILPNAFRNTS